MSIFSDRLTQLRENNGFSKTKTANMVGVSLSRYANWEYGYNDPDMETLNKLANVLGTTTDYLTGRTDNPNPVSTNNISETDLDELLDNVRSYDGKKMDDHDRDLIRNYLKGLFDAKS